jgi:beta-glucosidase
MNRVVRKLFFVLGVLVFAGCLSVFADEWDWAYKRAGELVSKMTLDEKCGLMARNSKAVPRLGIPPHNWWSEALHGVARNGAATQFPQAMCLASTWNPAQLEEITSAIGDEARAKHHSAPGRYARYQGLTIWSPTINMARDPRWGRTEETYGEDPYLTGRMAIAFVKGLQGDDDKWLKTAATVKHFVANNSEYNRLTEAYPVPERDLMEYYLPAFGVAVEEADVASIMTAYNGINGVPCSVNKWLLTDILRKSWGFNGAVVTDAGAGMRVWRAHHYTKSHAESTALMIKAGVDNISDRDFGNYIKPAIEKGLLTEAEVDQALIRNLAVRVRLGQFDKAEDCPYSKIPLSVIGCDEHRELARESAREGIVLLKNTADSNGVKVLPVDTERVKTILVAGPYADLAQLGTYSGSPTIKPISPFAGISRLAKEKGISVELIRGQKDDFTAVSSVMLIPEAGSSKSGLKAEYFDNPEFKGEPKTVRVDPSVDYNWPKPLANVDPDIPQPVFAVRWSGFVKAPVSGSYTIRGRADDGMRVTFDGKKLFEDWGKKAVRVCGSSRVKLEAGREYPITVEYFDIGGHAEAHLEWKMPSNSSPFDGYDYRSTMVVYVCGANNKLENESRDRRDITLRKFEEEEIQELTKRFPMTVVVLDGGGALAPLWAAENTPAIMDSWYCGQEGGTALAELLFGDVNPAGRLPVTFYRSIKDLPELGDYAVAGNGRTYKYFKGSPLWSFGHGLSYTSFEYGKASISKSKCSADDILKLKFKLTNSGERDGAEVVQVYVRKLGGGKFTPNRELKAFQRVNIKAGKKDKLSFTLKVADWARWNTEAQKWQVAPGDYEIEIGASSADIRQRVRVTVR